MYKDGKIEFKGQILENSLQLLSFLFDKSLELDHISSQLMKIEDENVRALLTYEMILFQGKITSIPRYSIREMLQAQDLLEILDLFETVNDAPYYVHARQLLLQYIRSKYDLKEYIKKDQYYIQNKCQLLDDSKSFSYNTILRSSGLKEDSPSKSIRQKLSHFLQKESGNANSSLGIFTLPLREENTSSVNRKIRYYLPIHSIPEFLSLYTYNEGRDFSNIQYQKNKDRLPRKQAGNSYLSYKITIEKIHECFGSSHDLLPGDICSLYRCNKHLMFFKFFSLKRYQDLYTSEDVMNNIIQNYSLTYSDIQNLDAKIMEAIFKDIDFIREVLSSSLLDPMLIFDIFFQFDEASPIHLGDSKGINALLDDIAKAKQKSLLAIKAMNHFSIIPENTDIPSLSLPKDVTSLETSIITQLNFNQFYIMYFRNSIFFTCNEMDSFFEILAPVIDQIIN